LNARDAIRAALEALRAADVENSEHEARWMLAAIMKIPPSQLFSDIEIPTTALATLDDFAARRAQGEPIQLILGEWEFFGRRFYMEKGVFIPRPETEGLVELVLTRLQDKAELCGLEVGVGSGAICVSLLCESPKLTMFGTDISARALALTRKNAELNGVADRLELIAQEKITDNTFDFILSNPPYLLSSEMDSLPREVQFDPPEALDGGADGLDIIRQIAETARVLLTNNGFVAMEIHENMAEPTVKIFADGGFTAETFSDIFGKDRYIFAERR